MLSIWLLSYHTCYQCQCLATIHVVMFHPQIILIHMVFFYLCKHMNMKYQTGEDNTYIRDLDHLIIWWYTTPPAPGNLLCWQSHAQKISNDTNGGSKQCWETWQMWENLVKKFVSSVLCFCHTSQTDQQMDIHNWLLSSILFHTNQTSNQFMFNVDIVSKQDWRRDRN